MINFIIGEDNPFFNQKYCEVVDKVMMKNNIEYKKHIFFDFNNDFSHKINENIPNKIYILDLVMPNAEGTNIANIIRENDIDSLIIFITSYYDEYEFELLNGTYMFLKFIDKAGDYQKQLSDTIESAIKMKRKNNITINLKDSLYRFDASHVNYANYDSKLRKTVINFDYKNNKKIFCNSAIKKIQKEFDKNFIKTKSGCIVNINNIKIVDKVNKIIEFNNGDTVDKVSKDGLKKLLKALSEENNV